MSYFLELARTLNFSFAAQKLGISQPTLTQALKKTETDLGVTLFERDGRELKITPYGRTFLEACGYITEIYGDTLQKLDDMKHGRTGTIRIGIAPSRAPFALPTALRAFREHYPDVRVEIVEMLTASIKKNVENGLIDLGVLVMQDTYDPQLNCIPVETEQVVVACHTDLLPQSIAAVPAGEDLCKADIRTFADVPFVMLGEEQLIAAQFQKLCAAAGVHVNCVARCKNVETSLALAEAAIGATLVTNTGMDYYRSAFPHLRYFDVSEHSLGRSVCVIHRKNQFVNPPLNKLIEILSKKEQ